MCNIKNVMIVCATVAILGLSSCGASIDVHANATGEAVVACNASLGKAFMAVMHSINGTSDNAPMMNLDDCNEMAKELFDAGLSDAVLRTPTNDSVEVAGRANLVELIKEAKNNKSKRQAGNRRGNLLTDTGCLTVAAAGNKKRLTLVLNAITLKALYNSLSEDVQAYLDLSMAGVFGGDANTKAQWLDALAIVYGKPFADEAADAKVTVNMAIDGGDGKTMRKTFTMPLADILTGQSVICDVEG